VGPVGPDPSRREGSASDDLGIREVESNQPNNPVSKQHNKPLSNKRNVGLRGAIAYRTKTNETNATHSNPHVRTPGAAQDSADVRTQRVMLGTPDISQVHRLAEPGGWKFQLGSQSS